MFFCLFCCFCHAGQDGGDLCSLTRDGTCAPCSRRKLRVFNHWTTGKVSREKVLRRETSRQKLSCLEWPILGSSMSRSSRRPESTSYWGRDRAPEDCVTSYMSHSLFGWVFLHIQSALGPSRVRKCLTASNRDPLKPKERVWVLFLRIQEVNSQKSGQEVCEGPAQAPVVNVPEIRPSNPWSKSEVLTCHGIYLVFPPLKWEERWQWSFLAKTLASLSTFQKTLEY